MTGTPAYDVVVIGEALVDIVETSAETSEHVGGSPANVALGLGRRGLSVLLVTQLGSDERGERILAHLEDSGVTLAPESFTPRPTSTALARIGPDGQASYVFDLAWNAFALPGTPTRVLHTGSVAAFLEPGAESVREALRASRAAEVTFDPNIRPALVGAHAPAFRAFEHTARLATVVKLSDEDAAWLYPGASLDAVVDAILALGPRLVAITLGSAGAIVATAMQRLTVPGERVAVVDTIGAGDTFMASLIFSVARLGSAGLSAPALERIGRDAVHAAALTVSRAGADLPWAGEL
ncbi:carbohydrate kinase [Microbacterium sp. P06]|uniref:carbohydrate kinase family protein n=1 Tax=Microbacterium sp. P06 TaxID=3366949 RepID=UPI00374583A2